MIPTQIEFNCCILLMSIVMVIHDDKGNHVVNRTLLIPGCHPRDDGSI